MLSAKNELAHVLAGMTEEEAEIMLDLVGVSNKDSDKVAHAIELLKIAARLLYRDGRPECVQAGEQVDAILKDLIKREAGKMLHEALTEILRKFARSIIAIIQRERKKKDE